MLLKNENKLDEMSHILEHFMKLVPIIPAEGVHILPNGSEITFDDTHFFRILLGGDQLTVARVHGTQALRATEDKAIDRLEGIIPIVADWHARINSDDCKHGYLKVTRLPVEYKETAIFLSLVGQTLAGSGPQD